MVQCGVACVVVGLCVVVLRLCLLVCLCWVIVWPCLFTVSYHVDCFCFICVCVCVCRLCVFRVLLCGGVLRCRHVDVLCAVVSLFVRYILSVCVCPLLLWCACLSGNHNVALGFNVVLFVRLYSCVAAVCVFVCVCFWFGYCRCFSCVVVRDV